MVETLKSLADLPDVGTVQEQTTQNPEQNNQQELKEPRFSKYAAKQRRRALTEQGPRDQQHQQHEIRRSANLQDTEKWMAIVRMATSLDQIASKVENLENRLNALVVPEQPPVDMEELRKNLWEDAVKHASSIVNLLSVRLEEQCQDLRNRQKEIQTQITNEVTAAHERISCRLSDLVTDAVDSRDLLRELLRRIGDPADTPISSRLREVQYIVKKLENPPDEKEDPQDRTHWLPCWLCRLLFDAEQIHVTDHGVWTETRVGDKIDFGGSSLLELWRNIRAAKKAYKVQQKIAALQAKLNKNSAAK